MLSKLIATVCSLLFVIGSISVRAGDYEDAEHSYSTERYANALIKYKRAAADGHAAAQVKLGIMYKKGQGVTQDYSEAARWFRLAADQGDATGQLNLGAMYNNGNGVPRDIREAVKWYRLAAAQGNVDAWFNLSICYEYGNGVPQNYLRAHMWANLAAATSPSPSEILSTSRDLIAKKMTQQQIAEAQRMAKACEARKYKGCE